MINIKINFSLQANAGITVIILVTHEDELLTDDKKREAQAAASRATGSPANQTFFIENYTIDDCQR
jgi:hypothetical protein